MISKVGNDPNVKEGTLSSALSGKGKTLPKVEQQDLGGVTFAEGTLKDIKVKEERRKNDEGVLETFKEYTATLTDGTVVQYEKQPNGEDPKTAPKIIKNKDGSIDFIGLKGDNIIDTPKNGMYNLMGCEFTYVNLRKNGKDADTVNFANIKDSNGNVVQNKDVLVGYDKGDKIALPRQNHPQTQEYNGGVSVDGNTSRNIDHVQNKRIRITRISDNYDKTVEYKSHDLKMLKESYVNAKEQSLPDGYKVKTSQNGKEQWFFTPDGKQISKKEFQNRGLE